MLMNKSKMGEDLFHETKGASRTKTHTFSDYVLFIISKKYPEVYGQIM